MAVFLTMAREIYCKDVKFSAYSHTHRESHNGIAMMDVDKVSCCIACNEPLFLAETARHKGSREDYFKGHRMIKRLAEKASLNAYIIWYHEKDQRVHKVSVQKISPGYSKIQTCSWKQWVSFLATFQVRHFPQCERKSLFMKKINSLTFDEKADYAEILLS